DCFVRPVIRPQVGEGIDVGPCGERQYADHEGGYEESYSLFPHGFTPLIPSTRAPSRPPRPTPVWVSLPGFLTTAPPWRSEPLGAKDSRLSRAVVVYRGLHLLSPTPPFQREFFDKGAVSPRIIRVGITISCTIWEFFVELRTGETRSRTAFRGCTPRHSKQAFAKAPRSLSFQTQRAAPSHGTLGSGASYARQW